MREENTLSKGDSFEENAKNYLKKPHSLSKLKAAYLEKALQNMDYEASKQGLLVDDDFRSEVKTDIVQIRKDIADQASLVEEKFNTILGFLSKENK